jgi:predicted  nucleic acid-binding Zn-ribbon protein
MREMVERRRVSLLQQQQQVQGGLAQLEQQRQVIQQRIEQAVADMNAVRGALQVCDSLLEELPQGDGEGKDMSLEELRQELGAESVGVVPEDPAGGYIEPVSEEGD